MLYLYDSRTGNTEKFVKKLGVPATKITENMEVNEPFILFTYTTGFGETPKITEKFVSNPINSKNLYGTIVSGNNNWGLLYGKCGINIRNITGKPCLYRFEISGTREDVQNVKNILEAIK